MSGMRGEGDADAARAEPAGLDGAVSAVSGEGVSGPGRDGVGGAAADPDPPAPARDAAARAVTRFWENAADQADGVTPEGLGAYLTLLVAAKNAHHPTDHAELLACGILATITALRQTAPGQMGLRELMAGITLVVQRYWIGWPPRDR